MLCSTHRATPCSKWVSWHTSAAPLAARTRTTVSPHVTSTRPCHSPVQVWHSCGPRRCRYFTRNDSDPEVSSKYKCEVLTPALLAQVKPRSAILDGEIVAWHKPLQAFLPFSVLKQVIFAAARDAQAGEAIVRVASVGAAGDAGRPSHHSTLMTCRGKWTCTLRP